jgi:hypothetical protein
MASALAINSRLSAARPAKVVGLRQHFGLERLQPGGQRCPTLTDGQIAAPRSAGMARAAHRRLWLYDRNASYANRNSWFCLVRRACSSDTSLDLPFMLHLPLGKTLPLPFVREVERKDVRMVTFDGWRSPTRTSLRGSNSLITRENTGNSGFSARFRTSARVKSLHGHWAFRQNSLEIGTGKFDHGSRNSIP